MISRFFVLSGLILRVNCLWLVTRILMVAFVLSVIIAGVFATFPVPASNVLADAFESAILMHGTADEIEMLRALRRERGQ